jgi:Activator of Hsp90 ATPase homolog 1-like protein
MTGEIHEFNAWIGGGYRMSLFYPPDECAFPRQYVRQRGHGQRKVSGADTARSIVEAVRFVTTDPDFFGEMTMITTFEEASVGTEVSLVFNNLPPGLQAEDNETGSRLSLEQLARRFE